MILLVGAVVEGQGDVDIRIEGERITEIGAALERRGAKIVELGGRTVVPAFVDAHVHLALYPKERGLAAAGVAYAVDWGAPIDRIGRPSTHLGRLDAGPLLTAVGGYPTQGWGRDGYGLEVAGDGVAEVTRLIAAGAVVIKLAMAGEPALTDDQVTSIVRAAHERGRKVGAHALSDAEAARAGRLGVDVLVHTPTQALSESTIALWKDRAVISTLDAFGSGSVAVENLRRLRAGGATVIYGTDLGNSRDPSIQCAELEALSRAGLDRPAILNAGTTSPAAFFDLGLGLAVGREASLLVLGGGGVEDLCRPEQSWIRGRRVDRL